MTVNCTVFPTPQQRYDINSKYRQRRRVFKFIISLNALITLRYIETGEILNNVHCTGEELKG